MNNIELTDGEREILLNEHPVVTHEYIVLTKKIEQVYNILRERVWLRRTGTFLYASPRTGKTYCSKAIQRLLEAEFPNIYTILLAAGEAKGHTVNGFIEDLVDAAHLASVSASKKKNLNHLVLHIQSETENLGGQQFVLLIDEMQLLMDREFTVLLTIHNRLELEKIKMTTIGFAQPEIIHRANMFRAAGENNLIARFLSEPIQFQGCRGMDELRTILSAYDDKLFYPDNTNWSFMRFFAPKAYANNLRLERCAEVIWDNLLNEAGKSSGGSIPMEHVTRTVENILMSLFGRDSPELTISDKVIREAARKSGLEHFTKLLNS